MPFPRTRIAFIHNQLSFLPEVTAYIQFFSALGAVCQIIKPSQLHRLKIDVAWHFMGTDRFRNSPAYITIHEYTSASVPPAAGLKNLYKRLLNVKPDYRLFLNSFVRDALSFNDSVPFGIRDMGIPASWLEPVSHPVKEYDFIYVGELKNRRITGLLDIFSKGSMRGHSLLLVTRDFNEMQRRYETASNIIFKGPVKHEHVREWITRARFGINFIPDESPFNRQTSTKFLEYAACKVPVITTHYAWMKNFQQEYGGKYFVLANDLSNFSWDNVRSFDYDFPDLTAWTWERKIMASGVPVFLEKHCPGLSDIPDHLLRLTNS